MDIIRKAKINGKTISLFSTKGGYVVKVGGKTFYDTRTYPRWENTFANAQELFLLTIEDLRG